MFLYELGVDEPARRRGAGRALVEALARLARERGCYGMWTGTEPRQRRLRSRRMAAAGGESSEGTLIVDWDLG